MAVDAGRGYFAECGMWKVVSRGNLWKIKCGTFRKLSVIAFPHSAAKKFHISADRKTTVCSHCTTDVQPMHRSIWRPVISSFHVPFGLFAKEHCSLLQFRLTSKSLPYSKYHIISLVDVIGLNLNNR